MRKFASGKRGKREVDQNNEEALDGCGRALNAGRGLALARLPILG